MKKIISAAVAAIMAATSLPAVLSVSAADDQKQIVVLGDSIAAGYGLTESEYNYGELVGDYYGAEVSNHARSGDETSDLIELLEKPSDEVSSDLKSADCVIVSIGGNDLIHYGSSYLLNVCANINVLKEGKTKESIPDDPTFEDLNAFIDRDALKAYAVANPIPMNSTVQKLRLHLTGTKEANPVYDCVIEQQIIPNIEKINADIKAINPDAVIVYQTVFNPAQFEQDYYKATYTGNAESVMNVLLPVFTSVTESFRDQLEAADLGGALIADIYNDFTSLDENGQKYAWYFTKMQNDFKEMDFHPTQAGHVAIAAKVIDTIGTVDKGGDLIVKIFESLENKENYPAVAYATYKKVADTTAPAGNNVKLGDPNNDGNIDAKDASAILTEYSKLSTVGKGGFDDEQSKAADVNKDTKVDAKDASVILSYYAYISTGGKDPFEAYIA